MHRRAELAEGRLARALALLSRFSWAGAALLALSDAGCAIVAAGLLNGKVVSPLALLDKPELAKADPLLSGALTVECLGKWTEKLWEVLSKCVELRWSAHEPNKLRLKTTGIHVSELFDKGFRLVEPFKAPP